MRRLVAGALTGVALATTIAASAETPPTLWDEAKNPGVRARYALHVKVNDLLALAPPPSLDPLAHARANQVARDLLEGAGAARSNDPLLMFDLGRVYEDLNKHGPALDVLTKALAAFPDHPGATDAYLEVAYANAHLDRPIAERDAYRHYLARETFEPFRLTALLNLAEAEMRLRNMSDAIAGYRATIELSDKLPPEISLSNRTLAIWGLAVALDRSGDAAEGARQAKRATETDRHEAFVGGDPNVFFVPHSEVYWYVGLGRMEDAKAADDPREAAVLWQQAEKLWFAYLDEAPKDDPWLGLARAHHDRCDRERRAMELRAAKMPKRAMPGGDVDL